MIDTIIGKKLGMTQVYDKNGAVTPVTVIQAGPCRVLNLKTQDKDGYSSVQIGYGERSYKRISKAEKGHLAKSKTQFAPAVVQEVRCEKESDLEIGSNVTALIFETGGFVDVTGTVKGRGFQGVVKRYNFGGGRASHGGDWERKPGSVGMCNWPAKIYKGRKMPGHMGDFRRTIMGLRVVQVREEENLILVKGAVPGSKGGVVILRKAKKKSA